MSQLIGALVADMSANSAAFSRDMTRASTALRSNATRMNRALGTIDRGFASVRRGIGRSMRNLGGFRAGLVALASPAAMGLLIRQSMMATDELAKQSDALGFTIEQMSALRFQASQTGVSEEQLATSLRAFIRGVGDLDARSGSLYTFLSRYDEGLLSNLRHTENQMEALRLFSDALREESDQQTRASLAAAAFGRQGAALVRTFAEGATGIDDYRARAEGLNIVMRDDLARSTEAANDEIDALTRQMRQQFNVAVSENAEGIRALTAEIGSFVPQLIAWAEAGLQAINRFSDRPMHLSLTFDGLGDQLNMVGSLSAELEQLQERFSQGQGNRFDLRGFRGRVEDVIGAERMEAITAALWEQNAGASAIPVQQVTQAYRDALREVAASIRAERVRLRDQLRTRTDEDHGSGDSDLFFGEVPDNPLAGFLDRMQGVVDAVKAQRQSLSDEARGFYDTTRTAAESYRAELERIEALQTGGFFAELGGAETAGRARAAALLDMAAATGELNKAFAELRQLSDAGLIDPQQFTETRTALLALVEDQDKVLSFFEDLKQAGDGVFRTALDETVQFSTGLQSLGDTVGNVVDSIRAHLSRLALDRFLFQPIEGAFNSFVDGLGSGGGFNLASLFGSGRSALAKASPVKIGAGKLPGFAKGGGGMIGGVGGTDSQIVQFRATPGERFSVETPQQQRAGAGRGGADHGPGDVHVHLHFSGQADAGSIRRARGEIAADLARVVRSAGRNL